MPPISLPTLAVLELGYLQGHLLGLLARLLLHGLDVFAQSFVAFDLLDDEGGFVGVLVHVVDDSVLDCADDPALDIGVSKLVLGLRLENRVLELDCDGSYYAVADVLALEGLAGELVYRS